MLNKIGHTNIPVSMVNPQKYMKPPISSNAKRTQSKTIKAALKLANKTSVVRKTQTSANPMLRYSSVPITSSVSHSEYDLKYNTTRLEIEKNTRSNSKMHEHKLSNFDALCFNNFRI